MTCPEICDIVAKALVDIQDTADLILLDLLEGRASGGAATRFAAIQQYASRAMEQLAYIAEDDPLAVPPEWAVRLRERHKTIAEAIVRGREAPLRVKRSGRRCA